MTGKYVGQGNTTCRSCKARCKWFTTPSGSRILINLESFEEAWPDAAPNISFDQESAKTLLLPHNHFATCPNADQHRRKR